NNITAYKLTGPVHGTVKVGFTGNLFPPFFGLLITDKAGAEVGINRHLLTGHGIKRKACGHLGNSGGPFGNDHKVNDDKDGKNDDPNYIVALHNKTAEGFNNRSGVSFAENQSRSGNIEGEPKER